MQKRELIFKGNEKQVFATDNPHQVIFRYTDVTVAYNNIKRARFVGKGVLDNQISAILLGYLNQNGIETHFIEVVGPDEQLCRKIEIIPLQVVIRNRLTASEATRLGVEDGFKPGNTVVEMRYNNSELGDPLINKSHAVALGLMTYEELEHVTEVALQANKLLGEYLHHAAGGRPRLRQRPHHHLRRDFSRYLPLMGRGHGRETGQGPFPSGPE